ncbi:hypothetical protein X943_002747 [Babesia divergens]|uniref:Uncharacterized protein n=1 Tax=Babesia divergens TaxID=32595 RepID=A0AAD9LF17_BABDI|nr:hypothetical protein X943_002747 [Babesia divergens]
MRQPGVGVHRHVLLCVLCLSQCLPQISRVAGIVQRPHIAFLSSVSLLRRQKHKSQDVVVFQDLLGDPWQGRPSIEFTSMRYPPYPYYDAPRNLFFDTSGMTAADEADDDGTTMAVSEAQQTYMNNSKRQRFGEKVDSWDSSPIAEFDRAIGKDHNDYVYVEGVRHQREEMTTDVAEYDAVRPGIAPWPTYEELRKDCIMLPTSLFVDLDPKHSLEKHLIGKPMWRNEIETLGEARTEQKRWLERSYHEEWPLTYKEFAELPLDVREAYYANRYTVCDEEERFKMVLNYRRSLGKAGDRMHPLEFRYMEDSYTHTPKESPVLRDFKNWDDPLDAPWRIRVEESIRDCVSYGWPAEDIRLHTSFDVYDVTWLAGLIKIVIVQTRDECGPMSSMEIKLMLLKLGGFSQSATSSHAEKRLEELDRDEHTESIKNHLIALVSLPSSRNKDLKDTLICRRDWNANIGKEVTVKFTDSAGTTVSGVMLGSRSTLGLDLEVDGERRTLPLNFVHEVKLVS